MLKIVFLPSTVLNISKFTRSIFYIKLVYQKQKTGLFTYFKAKFNYEIIQIKY